MLEEMVVTSLKDCLWYTQHYKFCLLKISQDKGQNKALNSNIFISIQTSDRPIKHYRLAITSSSGK